MSRSKREGRYAGFAFGNHYRRHDYPFTLPRARIATARYVEMGKNAKVRRRWIREALWKLGLK